MDRVVASTTHLVFLIRREDTALSVGPDRKHEGYQFVSLRDPNNKDGVSFVCSLPNDDALRFQGAFDRCEYVKVWLSIHTRNAPSNTTKLPKNYLDFYFYSHIDSFVPTSVDDTIQIAAWRDAGDDEMAFTVIGTLLPDDDSVDGSETLTSGK